MMKKINESSLDFASWVVNHAQKNPQSRDTISKWIEEKDPTIDLVSSLRSLSPRDKKDLKNELKTLKNTSDKVSITASGSVLKEKKRKTQFKIFLKLLSSISELNTKKIPQVDWIVYYKTKKIKIQELRELSDRFLSLSDTISKINIDTEWVRGFWGIYPNGIFTYGFTTENNNYVIDEFKFSKNFYSWLSGLKDKITWEIKKDFFEFDFYNLGLLYTIKGCIDNFGIKSSDKIFDFSKDRLIFGFKGVGKWTEENMDPDSFRMVKEKVRDYLTLFSWAKKVQYKLSSGDYWVYVFIKIKT